MGFEPLFTTRTDSRNGVAVVALAGELDIAGVPVMEQGLKAFERDDITALVVDLSELTFLDCSGVHALLAARQRAEANGHRLAVVGAGPPTRRLFELTRTHFLLDGDRAVDALKQNGVGRTRRTAQPEVAKVETDV
jgi:anti-anti-sigma factor